MCTRWWTLVGVGTSLLEFRRFRGDKTLIFLSAGCENRRRSHGGVRHCFPSVRRWVWWRQTPVPRLVLSPWWRVLESVHQTRWWSGNGRWTLASASCDVSCSRGGVALSTRRTLTSVSGVGASDASDDRARKRALWTVSNVASDTRSSSIGRVCQVVLKRSIILVTVGDQRFSFNRGHVALIRCELLRGIRH
jgi:hypothetical protein